jgi:hypothetical protein
MKTKIPEKEKLFVFPPSYFSHNANSRFWHLLQKPPASDMSKNKAGVSRFCKKLSFVKSRVKTGIKLCPKYGIVPLQLKKDFSDIQNLFRKI